MDKIEKLCLKLGLGSLNKAPKAVSGGLLHKMYRMSTDKGEYAIKVLNPNIMKRPAALQNMINSEITAHKLKGIIPLIASISFDGKSIIEFEGSYYIIYDWLDGKSVFAPDISNYHCEHIGRILGKIHSAHISIDSTERRAHSCRAYAWNELTETAQNKNAECYDILKGNCAELVSLNDRAIKAWHVVSENQVISHRDLDPKNVMWKDDLPFIIDWEAAGSVNPAQELIEVINYWAKENDGKYSKEKFEAILKAYSESMSISDVNWDAVFDCCFMGMLGWIEYNARRALGMEGTDIKDRQEGIQQVKSTINELKQQEKQAEQLKNWIYDYIKRI